MSTVSSSKPVAFCRALFEVASAVVRFPVWVILALPSAGRPRASWSFGRTLQLRILHILFLPAARPFFQVLKREPDYRSLEQGNGVKGVRVPAQPNLIVGDVKKWAEAAGVESIKIPGYWLEKKGVDLPVNAPPQDGEKVLYVLHGGGYARQSAHPDDIIANNPRGILDRAGPSFRRAFMIEYRNSSSPAHPPGNPFPAALIDAFAGYHYLVNEVGFAPENIVLEGDSAGGNLSLALVRYLVANKSVAGIPAVPSALVLISPWTDLLPDDPARTSSFHTNSSSDFISELVDPNGSAILNFLGPHGKTAAVTNPIIISGSTEIFLDQIRAAWHDFTLLPNIEPQRSEAFELIANWIDQ